MNYLNGGIFESSGEWIHGERRLDSNELIFVVAGNVYIEEDGTEYSLGKNDLLFLEKGKTHKGTRKSENVAFYWFHFKKSFRGKYLHISGARLPVMIRELFHYENSGVYPRRALDLMLELIMIEIGTALSDESSDSLLSRLCEWVRCNSDRKITVREASEKFKYNPDYLSRLVKSSRGVSLKEYIEEQRMYYIKKILLSGENNISEAAALCGFESYQTFLKFFTYHEHLSPSEYKRNYYRIHLNKS